MFRRRRQPREDVGTLAAAEGLIGSFIFSYALGFVLLGGLIFYAGLWPILSNTRLLDVLVDGGIVPLTDVHAGYGLGLPDLQLYVASQDPLDWGLLLITIGLFVLLAVVKTVQFHRLSRFVGIEGPFGQRARAYVYGHGMNRMLPFQVGDVATASALEGQGASLRQGAQVAYLARLFLIFEIVFFALVALYYVGVARWFIYLIWPLVIFVAAYVFRYGRRGLRRSRGREGTKRALEAIHVLVRSPWTLVELAALSIFAFFLVDVAAYFIAQAFSGDIVFLHPQGHQILFGVVGGYLARLIPVTPGGIGQFEWGFTAAMFASGAPFIDSATIALLFSGIRYFTGGIIFAALMLTYGIETDFRRVLGLFKREPVPAVTGEAV
jgi:uncharacterized membrane protein YbhN (UPF0104 family)